MSVRILSATDVRSIFTPRLALESQREAFTRLGTGEAVQPPRLLVPGPDASVSFCYSSRIAADGPAVSKFGSVNPPTPLAGWAPCTRSSPCSIPGPASHARSSTATA